ncbi:hypothetical protein X777_12761 [Ooceraea biroi]|uniref:Uncharacterized protein n=1 Tax=Ooceraea biroi TaxID=2015173 RepID=A0A026VYU5_OOCBI|nr:hypothetical protein X777_12761 [Ooceraea biroi]
MEAKIGSEDMKARGERGKEKGFRDRVAEDFIVVVVVIRIKEKKEKKFRRQKSIVVRGVPKRDTLSFSTNLRSLLINSTNKSFLLAVEPPHPLLRPNRINPDRHLRSPSLRMKLER